MQFALEVGSETHALNPLLKTSASSYKATLLITLSTSTVNQHLDRLGAMLRWGVDNGHVPPSVGNPFHKLQVKEGAKVRAARKKPRDPYTHAEIEQVVKVLDPSTDARHWLPLIAMYTGCRINEGAQLYTDDIAVADGIPFIHIRPGRPDQRVKTHKPRRVPIHPELVRRGFLAYVDSLKQPRLFPEFTLGRDGYGQSGSRWYSAFRKQHGIARDFHSYRHTVSAALDAVEVSERVKNAIFGHSHGKTMSETVYGHELPLAVVKQAIDAIPINPGKL